MQHRLAACVPPLSDGLDRGPDCANRTLLSKLEFGGYEQDADVPHVDPL